MELYEVIAEYARENGIDKFEAGDVNNEFVLGWAKEYAYNYTGTFGFMLDMRQRAASPNPMTRGMAKGVLNCALADYRFNGPSAPKPAARIQVQVSEAVEQKVPNGIYTAVFSDQTYRTIKISDDFREDAAEGSQMASYLMGPINTSDYQGFAFVAGDRVSVWRKFNQDTDLVQALHIILEDHETAGHAYALKSGRCWNCNRPLTVPDSIFRGLGPVCAERLGVA